MDKLSSKFNLYDHIGYFLVGGIGLLLLSFDFYLLNKISLIPILNTESLIVWVIAAYFMGHILQAIANIFVEENKVDFSKSEKEILEKLNKAKFKLKKQSDNELYALCYMWALAKDITGNVQTFNAYYSLYRGWFVAFCIQSVFLFLLSFNPVNQGWNIILFIVSILFSILLFKRSKRFYQYCRSKTLQTVSLLNILEK